MKNRPNRTKKNDTEAAPEDQNQVFFSADDLIYSTETTTISIGGKTGLVRFTPPSVAAISELQESIGDEDASTTEKNETMALFVAAHVKNEDGSRLFTDETALQMPFPVMKQLVDVLVSTSNVGEA